MKTRSSSNWAARPGSFDALNISGIDFHSDYPCVSSITKPDTYEIVPCNRYLSINEHSFVSTFVDDYILERYWNNPIKYVDYFKKAKYVMSPDYSLLIGMPKPMQMWNVYRNRLVGHMWQKCGIEVIPTISWSDAFSFDYCFSGIGYGSTVCISNIGCTDLKKKSFFDNGFEAMRNAINPKYIVFQCNNKYKDSYKDENIIFIDSFWDSKRKQLNK